jgi:hypothetical protein
MSKAVLMLGEIGQRLAMNAVTISILLIVTSQFAMTAALILSMINGLSFQRPCQCGEWHSSIA